MLHGSFRSIFSNAHRSCPLHIIVRKTHLSYLLCLSLLGLGRIQSGTNLLPFDVSLLSLEKLLNPTNNHDIEKIWACSVLPSTFDLRPSTRRPQHCTQSTEIVHKLRGRVLTFMELSRKPDSWREEIEVKVESSKCLNQSWYIHLYITFIYNYFTENQFACILGKTKKYCRKPYQCN